MRGKTTKMWQFASFALCLAGLFICGQALGRNTHEPEKKPAGNQHRTLEAGAVVTLEELLGAAVEGNPGLKAAMQSAHAARQMVTPARTLPDPTFTFQNMAGPDFPQLDAGDATSGRTYTLEQELPFPGKLDLKGKIASSEADVQELGHAQFLLQLKSNIKQAYYDLFFTYKSMETLRTDKELLLTFTQIAETRYQTGQGIQQDVVKAQVEISKLIDRLVNLDRQRHTIEADMNKLLYRSVETPIGKPAEFEKAELIYSLDELLEMARSSSPTIQTRRREIEGRQYGVELAQKEYYPDFALGASYVERRDQSDMYGIMIKAKLPVYFWRRQRPELEAARANLMSAQMMRNETVSDISSKIREAYVTATTADQLIKLYYSAIVPQSRMSLESAMAGYQAGKVDFLTLIDNLVTLLDYELKYYESLNEYQKALARLEPLVGMELTR